MALQLKSASLLLFAVILAACGGGGDSSNATASADNKTEISTTLSADQVAFESMALAPEIVYSRVYSLPASGSAINGRYYFYDLPESLDRSPLTNGPQRVVSGAPTAVSNNQNFKNDSAWFLVNGALTAGAFPYIQNYRYQDGSIVVDLLATDGTTVVSSYTASNVANIALRGAVASPPAEFAAWSPTLFSNGALLKSDVNWRPGAAYLKFTQTILADIYTVFDSSDATPSATGPTPLLSGTTLASQLSGSGISLSNRTYTLANGRVTTVNGVTTYIATAPSPGTTSSPSYQAFYEINRNIYAGSYWQAGATTTAIRYNAAARASLQNAMTF